MGTWKVPSRWGSLREGDPSDPFKSAFHAGHLNDVLRLDLTPDGPVLVASDTSGVWIVSEGGGLALPLSWTWRNAKLNCLANGYYTKEHIYAAGDALYETDTTQALPLLNWREIPLLELTDHGEQDLRVGFIFRVAVVREMRRIVLATETGVYFAHLPDPGGPYLFKRAFMLPGQRYSGLAEGSLNRVVVAAWGTDLAAHFGIFVGTWSGPGGDLTFSRASVLGSVSERLMHRTELSACAVDRNVLYAVCGGGGPQSPTRDDKGKIQMDGFGDVIWDGDDFLYRVLRSVDGGLTWNVTGSAVDGHPERFFPGKPGDLAGHTQGGYNLCVGASPFDPNLVAVGVGTPFLSKDGGKHWMLLNGGAHLHADIHAVVFDPTDSAHLRLDVCSDGGLATTPDLGGSFSTAGNRQLPNFQFTRFAPSPHDIGLLAGSLQDNGTVYAPLYVNSGPWRDLDGGDGSLAMFLQTGPLVRHNNTLQLDVGGTPVEYGSQARAAEWTEAKREMRDLKLFPAPPLAWGVIPVDGTADGLHADHGEDDGHFVTEAVTAPIWRDDASELLLAVAGRGETIFGLFAADGGPLHWRVLGTVPHQPDKDKDGNEKPYFALTTASLDGSAVYVGMNNALVFRLDAPTWTPTDLSLPGNTQPITRFAVAAPDLVFAIAGTGVHGHDGLSWSAAATGIVGAPSFQALDVDRTTDPVTLHLTSADTVWQGAGPGVNVSWSAESAGLPTDLRAQDLRFVTESSGASFVYLSTFGWSVFRRLVNFDEVERQVTVQGHMDLVDRVAVGKDEWAHPTFANTFVLGPERPIGEAIYTEDDGDEVQVILHLRLEWHTDFSVVVNYEATLISKDEDEDDNPQDSSSGTFTVTFGMTNTQTIDLASDEWWPDRGHIEFTVTNP